MRMQNEYINREAAIRTAEAQCVDGKMYGNDEAEGTLIEVYALIDELGDLPAADVVEVVRCHDCVNAVPLERNCELNANVYMHCKLQRGEPTENVWHKYKRFYRDYSIVEHDDFCSYGERREDTDVTRL